MIGVPIKKKKRHRDRQETRRMPYNYRGRHWNDAVASQRTPRTAATPGAREQGNEWQGRGKILSRVSKGVWPHRPLGLRFLASRTMRK